MTLDESNVKGCLWGAVLGDALGEPVEFLDWEGIQSRFGPGGILEPVPPANFTDDTAMTIAVAKALKKLGKGHQLVNLVLSNDERVGLAFAKAFVEWLDNPGLAPGITCTTSVLFLKREGISRWRWSGQNDSKGCGTIMRSTPLGLWFADAIGAEIKLLEGGASIVADVEGDGHRALAKCSRIQSRLTHGHDAATAAALAGSYSVALLLNGAKPGGILEPVRRLCDPISPDFAVAMDKLQEVIERRDSGDLGTDVEALHALGEGWVGDEAYAMAMYCVLRYPDDLVACLRAAVNHSGDSDSVGCVAGGMLGASLGKQAIPASWVNHLREKDRIETFVNSVVEFLLYS